MVVTNYLAKTAEPLWSLAPAGLAATAEVMQLNATLTHLAAQRGALVAAAASPQFTALVDQLQVLSALAQCSLHSSAEHLT
jgi:hypothetical protein